MLEFSFSDLHLSALFSPHLPAGLRGTEMWGGGFSAGYELFGQIFISGGYKKNKTTASRSNMHVSCIQNEGDCSLNGREALHLHWQLCPAWRTAGNWVLHKYIKPEQRFFSKALLSMKILCLLFITVWLTVEFRFCWNVKSLDLSFLFCPQHVPNTPVEFLEGNTLKAQA